MKNLFKAIVCICLFLFLAPNLTAQEVVISQKELKVKKHPLMTNFEPGLVTSAEDRLAIKRLRKEETERKLAMLDTMDISKRKRRRLLKELLLRPYSTRLSEATAITEVKFEDDEENEDK